MGKTWTLIKQTFSEFSEDNCFRLAAALSYYTVFSLAPLLVIIIAVVGLVFGEEAAKGQIVNQFQGLLGQQGAQAVQEMVQRADRPSIGSWSAMVGAVTLLVGATTVFVELKGALNQIWNVRPSPGQGFWALIRIRLLSFAMILGVGFLLLVSLVIDSGLSAAFGLLSGLISEHWATFAIVAQVLVSLLVTGLMFAMIFKYLPDSEIRWRDTMVGAVATAVLFAIGRGAIGLYLGRSNLGATYGSATALVLLLLWVYYSSLILFLGAEFTQVYSSLFGSGIKSQNGRPDEPERA